MEKYAASFNWIFIVSIMSLLQTMKSKSSETVSHFDNYLCRDNLISLQKKIHETYLNMEKQNLK